VVSTAADRSGRALCRAAPPRRRPDLQVGAAPVSSARGWLDQGGTQRHVPRVIRIFRFRLAEPQFDNELRRVLLPELRTKEGVVDVYGGRRDRPNPDERIVASVWSDRAAMVAALGESIESSPFHPELLELSTDREISICDLEFGDRDESMGSPAVLRLVEGKVRSGELDAYVEEARRGTIADRDAGRGPLALYLGCSGGDSFKTVSIWPDWATLQDATGGRLDRPIATRHAERLVDWTASHYEVMEPD
jgi:hypothetical protein